MEDRRYHDEKFLQLHDAYVEPYHYYFSLDPFNLHKELYWGLEYYSYTNHIVSLVRELDPSNLLDVGCGDGFLINTIARQGSSLDRALGIDLSDRAIQHANAFRSSENAAFEVRDVKDVQERFELVLLIEVLEHIGDDLVGEFVSSVLGLLEKDGTLIVSVPTRNIPLIETHHRHYDLELLTRHLGPGLRMVTHRYLFNRRDPFLRLYRRLMINRFFVLRNRAMLDFLIGKAEPRFTTTEHHGAHLVAVFRK